MTTGFLLTKGFALLRKADPFRPGIVMIVILVIREITLATRKKPQPSSSPTGETWTLANAKSRLSEVVKRAQRGPQIITRNGKPRAVIVSAEEWARKTARRGTLAEFLLASPLRRADIDLERQHDVPRDVPL